MKTYILKKELPGLKAGKILQRHCEGNWRDPTTPVPFDTETKDYLEKIHSLSERLEEITKPSYIVTEEGEIIGEYNDYCWFPDGISQVRKTHGSIDTNTLHFITKEQAEAYVKREKARRELWVLYYENGYEENKGDYEVFYDPTCTYKLTCFEGITNPGIPHCTEDFQEEMLELPRVEELYKIIFGIDESSLGRK